MVIDRTHQLSFELLCEVCSVIQDSGFIGNAIEYALQYYKKPFDELTQTEAEYIVNFLKPGCLFAGDPKDLDITPIPEDR